MGKAFVDPFDDFKKNRDRVTRKQPAVPAETPPQPASVVSRPPKEPTAPEPAASSAPSATDEHVEEHRTEVPSTLAAAARGALMSLGSVQPKPRPVAIPEWPGGSYARIAPAPPDRGEIVATLGLAVAIKPDDAPPFELALGTTTGGQPWVIKIMDHYVRRAARGELGDREAILHGHPVPPGSALSNALLVPWSPVVTIPTPRGPAPLLRILLVRKEELAWAALFGRARLLELMKAHTLLSGAPERRGLLEILPARPKILDAQKAAANDALATAGKSILAAAGSVLDRAVPVKGPGTGWEEGAITAFGDGTVELEVFNKAGVKKTVRWRVEAEPPPLDGQSVADLAAPARALVEAAGLLAAEPAATKPGRFMRIAYALTRAASGPPKGELRTF